MYTIAGITDVFARLIIKVSQLTSAQVMRFSLASLMASLMARKPLIGMKRSKKR